eukprot:scaffold49438_cov56-Phaeocystis_antarctica.AAC.7
MQDDAWTAEGRRQRTADDGSRPPPGGKLGAASGFAWHPWLARTFCGVGTMDDEANLGQVVAWLSILKHLVQLLHSGPRVLGHLGCLLEVFGQMRPLGDREHAFPAVQAVRCRARQVATVVLVNRHAHCSTGRMGGVVEVRDRSHVEGLHGALQAFTRRLVDNSLNLTRRRHHMIVAIVEGVTVSVTVVHMVARAKSAVAADALRGGNALRGGAGS